jgi:diguanylate cyclase (GGDEF)-like protein
MSDASFTSTSIHGLAEWPLLDAMQIGVLLLNKEGQVLSWNRWFMSHLSPARQQQQELQASPHFLSEHFPETVDSRLEQVINQALSFNLSSIITPGLNRPVIPLYDKPDDAEEDRRMHQLIHVTAMRHPQVACMVQIQNMTAHVRRERHLRVQSAKLLDSAYQDSLTGVGNRRRFDDGFAQLFAKAQKNNSSIALVMIDIDHFKVYNDFYGHIEGDKCLQSVAKALQEGLRLDTCDLLCRYGGEEFAVLLPDADEHTACFVAKRLHQRVAALNIPQEGVSPGARLSISAGVASLMPGTTQASDVLITAADLALYNAKEGGRNCVMCYHMSDDSIAPCA